MSSLHFDSRAAGAKTQWIICFKKEPNPSFKRPSFDFYLPTPPQEGKALIKATDDRERRNLELFDNLQKACAKIKNECFDIQKKLQDIKSNPEEESEQFDQTVKNLHHLVQVFNWLMKKLYLPPDQQSPEPPPSNNPDIPKQPPHS